MAYRATWRHEVERDVVIGDDRDEVLVVVNPDPRVLRRILPRDLQRPIGAAVVDDDVLVVLIRLIQNALDAFGQVVRPVVDGRQYGHERRVLPDSLPASSTNSRTTASSTASCGPGRTPRSASGASGCQTPDRRAAAPCTAAGVKKPEARYSTSRCRLQASGSHAHTARATYNIRPLSALNSVPIPLTV